MSNPTLTGNDLALATFACAHAMNWCKKQGRAKYWKNEIAKYQALSHKLQAIDDEAFPIKTTDDGSVLDFGDEKIMRLDMRIVRSAQRRLEREARP